MSAARNSPENSPENSPARDSHPAIPSAHATRRARRMAAGLGLGIFVFDMVSPMGGAVAVLYVLVLLVIARTADRRDIQVAGVFCLLATIIAYLFTHWRAPSDAAIMRALVSLSAIGVSMALMLRNQASAARVAAQAALLDLSHDMIFMRDAFGRITFWNRAAEAAYGWSAAQAKGQMADDLLHTSHETDAAEAAQILARTGRWDGALIHSARGGTRIHVDSRWALQCDRQGRVTGVLETNTDVTEKRAQFAALAQSERRFRRMFDSSRIGIVQEDWRALRRALRAFALETGLPETALARRGDFVERARRLAVITDVNPAFLHMVGAADRGAFLGAVHDLLSTGDRSFGPALAAWIGGAAFYEGEARLMHADGHEVAVMFTMTFPSPQDEDGSVLVFSMDVSDARAAQEELIRARAQLAHAARVSTLGELSASIAHEVNQPLMAIVTSGEAGLRWLQRDVPDLPEVAAALHRITAEGRRAGEIVHRIRAFLGNAAPAKADISVAALITDSAALVARELERAGVTVAIDLAPDLARIFGDKVQLQQVLVNLMLNAAQAMEGQSGARRLHLAAKAWPGAHPDQAPGVEITVRDNGPGIAPDHLPRLFDAFFTTRADGMGMGLAICRRTIEAHQGQIRAERSEAGGTVFRLTLPAATPENAP